MKFIRSQHSVYQLSYHVIWTCKYRRRVLKPGIVEYIRRLLPKLLKSTPGVEIEQIGFDLDHVHFVMIIPPSYAISDVIGKLKSQSASLVRKKFKWLEKVYFKENIFWSPGYFVSSVGINEKVVKNMLNFKDTRIQVNSYWSCNPRRGAIALKNPGFTRGYLCQQYG